MLGTPLLENMTSAGLACTEHDAGLDPVLIQ